MIDHEEMVEVVNRAPKPARTPTGQIRPFAKGELSVDFWKSRPQRILMPIEDFHKRLDRMDNAKRHREMKRAGIDYDVDGPEGAREAVLLRIEANTEDPNRTQREQYLEDWNYQSELWPKASEIAKERDDELPSRKPECLADYLVVYHGTPEKAAEN